MAHYLARTTIDSYYFIDYLSILICIRSLIINEMLWDIYSKKREVKIRVI